jgi:hypothetical protein
MIAPAFSYTHSAGVTLLSQNRFRGHGGFQFESSHLEQIERLKKEAIGRCRPQRAASLCDSEHYTGETSADSLITSSQVIITASEIREILLR